MVDWSSDPVNAILGGKKPLLLADTSNFAELLGVLVPIPIWAEAALLKNRSKRKDKQYLMISEFNTSKIDLKKGQLPLNFSSIMGLFEANV